MEGEWSFYRGSHLNRRSGHVTDVASLRENGHVTEVVTLIEGEKSCQRIRGGQFNGERMALLRRWPVEMRENGHSTEVDNFMLWRFPV